MVITVAALLIPFIFLFFADIDLFLVSSIYLYTIVTLFKLYKKQECLLDIILLSSYSALFSIQHFFNIEKLIPYTGTVIYFVLSAYFLFRNLNNKRSKNAKPSEERMESLISNLILFFFNFSSLILSVKLFPSVLYIILPLICSFTGIFFAVFLSRSFYNTADLIKSNFRLTKEQKKNMLKIFGNLHGLYHVSGSVYGKEVCCEHEKELFFETLKKGYVSIFQKDKNCKNYDEFMNKIKQEYEYFENNSVSFVAYDIKTGTLAGCLRMVIGSKQNGLPMEKYLPVSFKKETVHLAAELGRLTVTANGIAKAAVIETLILLMIVKVLFTKVRFLYTDALLSAVSLYEKIGLKRITDSFYDKEFSQETVICGIKASELLKNAQEGLWKQDAQKTKSQYFIKNYLSKEYKVKKLDTAALLTTGGQNA